MSTIISRSTKKKQIKKKKLVLGLIFDIFQEFLLLQDEVLLLGELSLQVGDALLGCLQPLALLNGALPQPLGLSCGTHLQHLLLLKVTHGHTKQRRMNIQNRGLT